MSTLTAMDVKTLINEPSVKVRGLLASKIATDYRSGSFTRAEADIAVDIFRILLKDVEAQIRKSLSEQLAHCNDVPHDIILKLANDETEVAVYVLEHSSVLTETDLISIVRSSREVAKLCAIAKRNNVPESLSASLIDTHHTEVLQNLFENPGAELPERSLLNSWHVVNANATLLKTLVYHGGLPLTVAEKLFNAVSNELKKHLATRYKINTPFMDKSINDVREWELLGLTPGQTGISPDDDEMVEDLVDDLSLTGRLTHSLLIRALCVGNLNLFEAGLAKLSGVPRVNARILLLDSGGRGIHAIYRAAGMPEGFFDAVGVLLRLSLEETDFGRVKHADFRKRIIDRIQIEKYNQTVENMEYLLSIIGGRILGTANIH